MLLPFRQVHKMKSPLYYFLHITTISTLTIVIRLGVSGPLAKPGSVRTGPDRIGSDRIGPDRTGSDRTGPDRQNPDWFNIKIAANRHMKSLGHQLRLLPTFTGVLPEKVRTRVSIKS